MPADTVVLSVEYRRDKPRDRIGILVSGRCFYLFRCVLSSLLTLRIDGRSYFDKG